MSPETNGQDPCLWRYESSRLQVQSCNSLRGLRTRLEQDLSSDEADDSSSLWLAVALRAAPGIGDEEQALIDALEADGIAVAAVLGRSA